MTAISGRLLLPWLPNSSLADVFSRMFTDTSRWGSTRCWLTWKRSATPAGRSLFLLRPSAPRTGEIASGFWPTPDVGMTQGGRTMPDGTSDTGRAPDGRKVQVGLTNAVRIFPTPTKADGERGSLTYCRGNLTLKGSVMLPTPRHEGFDAGGHRGTNDSLHSAVKAESTGKISAAWVTRLMGYPDGWLDLAS